MSRLVARILLSIFLFPIAGVVFTVAVVILDDRRRIGPSHGGSFMAAGLLTWAVAAVYWWALWRSSVRWTQSRWLWTLLAFLGAALVGAVIGAAVEGMRDYSNGSLGAFAGSVLAIMLWLAATVFIWRETTAERAARVAGVTAVTCPACGYNLTGLTEARCPECGAKFTLDELLAAQSPPAAAALT